MPLVGTDQLVSLEPKPVLSPTGAEMLGLKFSKVQCSVGAAIPERFRQVKASERSVHCTYDIEYHGKEIGIDGAQEAFRLVRPDNTEVVPTDRKITSLSDGQSGTDLYVTFVIAADAAGTFQLRMRYYGLYTRATAHQDAPMTISAQ